MNDACDHRMLPVLFIFAEAPTFGQSFENNFHYSNNPRQIYQRVQLLINVSSLISYL